MKNKTISKRGCILAIFIVLLNLVFLFYLKYSHHHLLLSDFSFAKIGNIINYTLSGLTIQGILILYFRKINVSIGSIHLLMVLLFLFLVLAVVINFMSIPPKEYFLLSLSFLQVLIISAFSLFQFTQLFLMLFIWLIIFGVQNLIYLRALMNSIFIGAGLLVLTLIFINARPLSQEIINHSKSTLAIVLGAAVWSDNKPSPTLASRVDKAIELYRQGKVNKIQLTGGNAPGELSEAEVSLKYILGKGIDRNDVWIEKSTTSTIEQVRFIKNNLMKEKQVNSVIVISDIYHLQRVREICRFYDVKADVAASDLKLKTDKIIFYQLRECIALLLFWLFAL